MVVPQDGWFTVQFIMENPIKMDDEMGYPPTSIYYGPLIIVAHEIPFSCLAC